MQTKQMDEIRSAMSFLYQQIEEIGNYPDKSLFFQDPRVIEGWLVLVRAIKQIEKWGTSKDETDWEKRSETYVVPLLARRELFLKFKNLYRTYYDQLKRLWDGYGGWIDGECISADGIQTLINDKYDQVLDVEDFGLHLERVNTRSSDARYAVFKTLSDIFDLLQAVMNRGGQVVIDMNPSDEDIAKSIDDDLREWTLSFGKSMFKDMKEDLNRHFKTHPTDHNTPELWGEMLRADEDALKMAMRKQLTTCEDVKQEHWGEDMKKQMDENDELMRLIYSSCYTEELFDFRKDKNTQQVIALLTPDNLDMFYDIIVRRSLIQCEMFPELKRQHEEWLNNVDEQTEESSETGMSAVRQSKLDEIIGILQKGDWKQPATADNVKLLLETLLGRDTSLLEDGDEAQCEKMWAFVERGGGDRSIIVPAKLAGFFRSENLIIGGPKAISDDLFGKNNNQVNAINKGKQGCSNDFDVVIPFLTKYINKIIRQV